MYRFQIGGIPCSCSLLFPAVLLVLLLVDESGVMGCGVLAAVIHECGHLTAMFAFREKPYSITVSFYGVRVAWDPALLHTGMHEIIVALAGPFANLLCGAALCGLGNEPLRFLHIGLALFNLLPLFPLDGDTALRAILGSHVTNSNAYTIFEGVLYSVALVLGVLVFVRREHNPTLLFTTLYLITLRLFYKRN